MSSIQVLGRPRGMARGIILIMAAMFLTSLQDVVFKLFSSSLPLGQIFALRAILAFPLLFALAAAQGGMKASFAAALGKWPLIRAVFMTLMFLSFYAAIPFVSLSALGAATYIAPIIVTVLTAVLVGEAVGMRGWTAVFIGFAGVVILLQPGTDAFSPWTILPVMGAAFYAAAHVLTRTRCQQLSLASMVIALNLMMMLSGLALSGVLLFWQPSGDLVLAYPSLLCGWLLPGLVQWLVLGGLAILAVLISLGIAGAYQTASPPAVATFEYSYLVFVAIWDLLLFAAPPGAATITGMLLIIGAGLMVLRRQAEREG